MDSEYYLVKSDMLPEVFVKVMSVKRLLSSGKAESVNDAVQQVGLSRSAYYKYKDAVLPFYETSRGRLVTLIFNCMAKGKANILTINQNIPINGLADVSISIETEHMTIGLDALLDAIGRIPGVRSYRILARD